MNSQNIIQNRRENLEYLVYHMYGNQSIFATDLKYSALSQPTVSDILRKKRQLYLHEARAIEEKLSIPVNWMDKDSWVYDGRDLIEKYKKLTDEEKVFFNATIEFVANKYSKA